MKRLHKKLARISSVIASFMPLMTTIHGDCSRAMEIKKADDMKEEKGGPLVKTLKDKLTKAKQNKDFNNPPAIWKPELCKLYHYETMKFVETKIAELSDDEFYQLLEKIDTDLTRVMNEKKYLYFTLPNGIVMYVERSKGEPTLRVLKLKDMLDDDDLKNAPNDLKDRMMMIISKDEFKKRRAKL